MVFLIFHGLYDEPDYDLLERTILYTNYRFVDFLTSLMHSLFGKFDCSISPTLLVQIEIYFITSEHICSEHFKLVSENCGGD